MANTSYAYVRSFELPDPVPPSHYLVIRLDGRAFSTLTQKYALTKPNDARALHLMNACAASIMRQFPEIVIAYGQSDEYSFVFGEETRLFERRGSKLASVLASAFTGEFCLGWEGAFCSAGNKDAEGQVQGEGEGKEGKSSMKLTRPYPSFDARCVAYPKRRILRDYLSWRQADCHINNLYNTTFWALVLQGGMSAREAEERLKGTVAGEKNEILFSRFGINYNDEPEMFRKGTVVYRALDGEDARGEDVGGDGVINGGGSAGKGDRDSSTVIVNGKSGQRPPNPDSRTQREKERKRKAKARIVVEHTDIIGDAFWARHPYILGGGGRGGGGQQDDDE